MSTKQFHSTSDEALSHLVRHEGAVGDLVRAFLTRGNTEDRKWLETWLRSRIEIHIVDPLSGSDPDLILDQDPGQVAASPLALPIELKSMQINYFRGFGEAFSHVDMGGNLIVIEGRNSSGKTSLAEALEWLFSGHLSRRESSSSGNARELKQCITNTFRPISEDTWVSATFVSSSDEGKDEEFTLRRVLLEDYGTTAKATCKSSLFLNDKELAPIDEGHILEKHFAGVPPLLMQHTLRDFVQSDPKRRHMYFERLLHLDELSELIRQAVMTDGFPSPSGNEHLRLWNKLNSYLTNVSARKIQNQTSNNFKGNTVEEISDVLSSISKVEFPSLLEEKVKKENIVATLQDEQVRARQDSFPMLTRLRPRTHFSDYPNESRPTSFVDKLVRRVRDAWRNYESALLAVDAIGDRNLAVSKAFKLLLDEGIIMQERNTQSCPLCAYEHSDTLSADRITTIESWDPIRRSEQATRQALKEAINSLVDVTRRALEQHDDLLPSPPTESDWNSALQNTGDPLQEEAKKLRTILEKQNDLSSYVENGRELVSKGYQQPDSIEECESLIGDFTEVITGLEDVPTRAREYADALASVEAAVGVEASSDPKYRLRKCLIECFENTTSISRDLRWEQAQQSAQRDLQRVRESLMAYRQQFLEDRRMSFNNGIESVWKSLRKDKYSSFSQLHIPPPRGKGFPIEIELKASLDDRSEKVEVDALRVFSESQVNALGIAAFVTRAKSLGQRLLIFDDPVQSMDEEHFTTFARDLIPQILDNGFQVVLLTHNVAFARDVSHFHFDRTDYVTMSIRHSRQSGSVVEEGNRRVSERLKLAEGKLEDGHFDEAWKYIRFAIERLYLITYLKYGPSKFRAQSWQHQTAEYMWNSGAGQVISSRLPNSEMRLKDILDMTAGGAHDTPPKGETDLRDSIDFLRNALNELKLGG